jgi:predicted transcriptional regulator
VPLTKRRMQFLNKLMELHQKTNLPIHYETLAQSMGVSKWTAYDMLKEIEKQGFISRSYEVNNKETGRSQVVFIPTSKAWDLLKKVRNETIDLNDWEKTVEQVLALLKNLNHCSLKDATKIVLDEISKINTRLNFCAYIIGLFAMYVKKLGNKTEFFIQRLFQKAPSREMGMTMFVGTVLGTIIETMNDDLGTEIVDLVSKFLQLIAGLSDEEKEMLSDFLSSAFD